MLNLAGKPRMAACDKGWTLVQRRKDGTVQFNKDWEDYAVGFGTPQGWYYCFLSFFFKKSENWLAIVMLGLGSEFDSQCRFYGVLFKIAESKKKKLLYYYSQSFGSQIIIFDSLLVILHP